MATSIVAFDLLQAGIETTKGTLVPATRKLPGEGTIVEEQDFYRSPYPAGVRATVGGAGTILRKGLTVDWNTDLNPSDILWPLLTGIRGAVSPSAGAGGEAAAQTWTFTPQLTTGVPTIDAATIEYAMNDGSTAHYYREAGYAICESFKIEHAVNAMPKLSWKWFARAGQTGTVTSSLTPYTIRHLIAGNLLSLYLDTSWAGLGGTQLTGVVRSGSIDVMTGFKPDYTSDGRSDLDMTKHSVGALGAKVGLVLELDSVGAARIANYRANDLVYVRHKFLGGVIPTCTTSKYTVQVDGAYRFGSPPSISNDGDQKLVTLALEAVYDSTGTKILEFTAINELTAVA